MKIVETENTPIIFPKYTLMLIENHVDVRITGNKEADSKLASVLYSAIINDEADVPDIMKYDIKTKTWESIYILEGERIALKNRTSTFVEYVGIVSNITEKIILAIRNFVMQYSAAKLNA